MMFSHVLCQVQHVADERAMLQRVAGHPFMITLKGTFQDAKHLFLVMEFVKGGEFFTLLRDKGRRAGRWEGAGTGDGREGRLAGRVSFCEFRLCGSGRGLWWRAGGGHNVPGTLNVAKT